MAIIWLMMGNTNLVNNDGNMVIMMVNHDNNPYDPYYPHDK